MTGELLDGRYRVEAEVGAGAAARVLRCRDERLERTVAVKLLAGRGEIADPARLREEAQLLARLRHPGIVAVFEAGLHQGQPYLVLEWIEGGSLEARLADGPLAEGALVPFGIRLLEALAFAHRAGILHRDIKSANVLLGRDGSPRLADFGLAKALSSGVRTKTGLVLGTPEYMAPELFRGDPASPASDLWSLGCVFYEAAAGQRAITGSLSRVVETHARQLKVKPPVGGRFGAAIAALLEPDPARRADAARTAALLAEGGSDAGPGTEAGRGAGTRGPAGAAATRIATLPATGVPLPVPPPLGPPPEGRTLAGRWLGLAGLGLAALVLWAGRGAVPAGGEAARAPTELAEDWIRFCRDLDVVETIAATHRGIYGDPPEGKDSSHEKDMAEVRLGTEKRWRAAATRAARGLPRQDDLDRDREALARVMEAPGTPLELRLALYTALTRLSHLDTYFESWGVKAPYGVAPLLGRLFPLRVLPAEPKDEQGTLVDPALPLGPGVHLVAAWTRKYDRKLPILVTHPEDPSEIEKAAWTLPTRTSGGEWSVLDHGRLEGSFDLPAAPAAVFGTATFRVSLANLVLPNSLVVDWNGTEVWVRGAELGPDHGIYSVDEFPTHRVAIGIPPGTLRAGPNRVRLTIRELPGLRHTQGMDADFGWLELAAPP